MRCVLFLFLVIVSGCSAPLYGNFCGPGHPADDGVFNDPNAITSAVDWLDRICFQHDVCYLDKGYADCSCDQTMLSEIYREMRSDWNTFPPEMEVSQRDIAKISATLFVSYFETTVCVPRDLQGLISGNNAAKLYLQHFYGWSSNPVGYEQAVHNLRNQLKWSKPRPRVRRNCSTWDSFNTACESNSAW